MDPTQEERNNQAQQEKSREKGITDTINNLVRVRGGFKNPLGRIGARVATQTALRGFSALLASQVGLPIAIALGAILFFTIIIIMGFGGAPGSPSPQTSVQVPIAEPIETLTPTPAEPESAL